MQLHADPLAVHYEKVPRGLHQRFISCQVAPFFPFCQQLYPHVHLCAIEELKDLFCDAIEVILPTIERHVRGCFQKVVKLVVDVLLEALMGLEAIIVGLVV